MRSIFSFLAILIGALLTIKSDWFLNNFGRIEWAERYLGTEGGSRLFYKLLGLIIVLIAFLIITGLLQNWFLTFFAPFFQL